MRPPALSVWRPYPALIFGQAAKNIENRPWKTNYRGPLLIHAAKGSDPLALSYTRTLTERRPDLPPVPLDDVPDNLADHPLGIIGVVELYDICSASHRTPDEPCGCPWWAQPGRYHWKLRNPAAFPQPVRHPGKQGQWSVADDAWPHVFAQLKAVGRAGGRS